MEHSGKLEIEHSGVCSPPPYRQKHPTLRASDDNSGGLFADVRLKHVAHGVIGINSMRTKRRQRQWSQSTGSWTSKFLLCVFVCCLLEQCSVRLCQRTKGRLCERNANNHRFHHYEALYLYRNPVRHCLSSDYPS